MLVIIINICIRRNIIVVHPLNRYSCGFVIAIFIAMSISIMAYADINRHNGPGSFEVYDIKGRKVDTVYFSANGDKGSVEIDARTSNLSPSVYIGRVKTDVYSSPVKFIVE